MKITALPGWINHALGLSWSQWYGQHCTEEWIEINRYQQILETHLTPSVKITKTNKKTEDQKKMVLQPSSHDHKHIQMKNPEWLRLKLLSCSLKVLHWAWVKICDYNRLSVHSKQPINLTELKIQSYFTLAGYNKHVHAGISCKGAFVANWIAG